MKTLSPIKEIDGIIYKYCGGKNGCRKWLERWKHYSEKETKIETGCQYIATCDACIKTNNTLREAKRYRRVKVDPWPVDRIYVDAYAMPWKPNLKPYRVTGMFGC
jgi:hypothetical protein